ncbi:winged helix-turn-helix domain-containing protein [Sphingomicrobium marinum]|uniref:winged helix-turn-helix domain-containing protein n=1 Tax=Sphingomicrobium marinum TaxID=1227950 RepID=UPI002240B068|nr:winged helix-turn-helix domain-containing protein [Sphingomicrobium marinum]
MAQVVGRGLAIGEFRIDLGDERLLGPHGPVKLGNKAFQVLVALAERDGRLLTKDKLFESVWDGMAVSESALTTTVRELRNALGDPSRHPRYIESVYGRGYRLIASVRPWDGKDLPSVQPSRAAQPAPKPEKAKGAPPRVVMGDFKDEAVTDTHPHAGDAMREEVLLGLSRFREIQVIANAAGIKGGGDRDYQLDATLLPDGNDVKIVARVHRLGDGGVVWAETMKLDGSGLGAGIEKIVRQIVGAALPALDQDVSIGIGDAAGSIFDRYLVAKRHSVEAQTRAEAEDAARELEAIVAEQPGFALAYPPLVRLYNIDYGYTALGSTSPVERARALELAKAGLAADRSHVHAYTVLGFCHLYHGEFDQAHSSFEHALERNPFNPVRLNEVATGMRYLGDFTRSRELIEQSRDIQPFADDNSQEDLGHLYMLEGDCDAAGKCFAKVTVASIWTELYAAICAHHKSPSKGIKAVDKWRKRVVDQWHRPIPPSSEEIFEWFRFHHPYKDDAGAKLIEAVKDALGVE